MSIAQIADHRPANPALRPGMPLVEGAGIGLRQGGRWVLRDVDLTVGRGEIVTVIGPNGGGKTTLLRVLLGLTAPTLGTVRRGAALRVGYMPQRFAVDPVLPLPVRRLMTLTRAAPSAAVDAALAETGVGHLADALVQDLSGGELQRVLLARALLAEPDLLVMDEPVQGVDPAGEAALYQLIGRIRDDHGCGVLMVSHDLHVVMAATDRVMCLNGHVCCSGAPHDISRHPEYLRLFGARAADAYAVYRHDHACDHEHDAAAPDQPASGGA